jgi:hypothetical protein
MNRISIDPSRIRERAHARWLARGCPQGADDQDWLEAERELQREAAVSAQQEAARVLVASGEVTATVEPRPQLQPPRPRLRRSPTARTAHLHNEIWLTAEVRPRGETPVPPQSEVTSKAPPQTRVQQAIAAAAAAAVVQRAG